MRINGTKEAFEKLLSERGIYKRLNVDRSTVSNWKKGTQKVSLDKMEAILLKAGATIVKEKIWNVPAKKHGLNNKT